MSTKRTLLDKVSESIQEYCSEFHNYQFDSANPAVKLHEPTFSNEEIFAATKVMLSTFVTQGANVKGFEKEYAKYTACKYGVMCNSGSSANLLAVAALCNPATQDGLKPGDEVIVPALSWSTTVWPLIQLGLIPVIVDIDPDTLNIDPNEILKAINPRTKAVMLVHVYGNPCDMDAICSICDKHQLILIEDSCESMGASYDGKPVGSIGRVGTFSTYFSHHISTLEGGVCVTNDNDLSDLMRILRAHGWVREIEDSKKYTELHPSIDPRFLFVNIGYNLRATEAQAAMGLIQLPKLDQFVDSRRQGGQFWTEEIKKYGDVLTVQDETPKSKHSWFGIPLTIKHEAPFTMKDLRDFFETHNIETRPIICGNIAIQPAMKMYQHKVEGGLNFANNVLQNSFSFGNHQWVNQEARDYIAHVLYTFMREHGVA
ncbi:DegT/DnrJ/EryC1/StrS family aminotransferase [Alphaproteobacteria bacterium]|nr:DegT/DnrJ/EryC1/StrS family aminotransferase [Alphaproteobacteria bacterium]